MQVYNNNNNSNNNNKDDDADEVEIPRELPVHSRNYLLWNCFLSINMEFREYLNTCTSLPAQIKIMKSSFLLAGELSYLGDP